jgi:putative spermidine/putrescine transport system permease protein
MTGSSAIAKLAIAVALVLIIVPILVVVGVAFSSSDFFYFPPPGLSLRWFREFFANDALMQAFRLSIVLALTAASAATVLGVMAALYVSRRKGGLANSLQLLFMAPLVFPTIILGLALLIYFKTLGVGVLQGLAIAHAVVVLPYAFRSALAALQSFDPILEEAGQSLGASPAMTFLLVTLPNIWPGVLAGWLFGFVVSFGELNTSLFLTGPGVTTLPIEIFSRLQFEGSQLVIAAASAVQVGLIMLLVLVIERIIGLARIVQR